ncbi:DNAJC11 domain-containing protein [Roseateles puraquae]|nr:DUF3395 domain-containing protein [Roseateles puraquae]MDG0852418.1 DUF3395 domain-containing protein [Roseateles puraquae]
MQRRHLTLGLFSSLTAGLLSTLALPARADDEGDFVILRARYGTENRHVDVTGRLRDLARQDRRFKLTNDLFGIDPDPGRTKTLRIFARDRYGREQQFEYREYDWVDGAQFIGWGRGNWGDEGGPGGWHGSRDDRHDDGNYVILYATYGASGRDVDVTDRLRDLARRDQRLRLTNELFGVDPYPGQTKILRIFTRERGGQERTFEYREYQTIDGNQFVGWGRGDWGRGSDRGPVRPGPGGRFVIESASYGSGNRWVDVTQAVRAQVRGDRLDLPVSNDRFGVDPAPGERKTLSVTYRFGNEPSNTVRVSERDTLRLP